MYQCSGVSYQQPTPYFIQSMSSSDQLPPKPYDQQPYQYYSYPANQYIQQCDPQHNPPVKFYFPAMQRVFVYDGYSWNEHVLENVISG